MGTINAPGGYCYTPATSTPSSAPTWAPSESPTIKPAMACTTSWLGDGYCDDVNNNALCNYDNGDCCSSTCVSTAAYACGYNRYNCLDPRTVIPTSLPTYLAPTGALNPQSPSHSSVCLSLLTLLIHPQFCCCPSGAPVTARPSTQPSRTPTAQPSTQPSTQPVMRPSRQPSSQPTRRPSRQPTRQPSSQPSRRPSSKPSGKTTLHFTTLHTNPLEELFLLYPLDIHDLLFY